jgi:DNA segregation ATPase FtsK/SpoIIIE, S-DNA-T family
MTIDDSRDRNVRYLPGAEPTSLELAVLDAELVTPEEERALTEREKAIARWEFTRHDVVVAGRFTKRVVTHDVTIAVVRNVVVYPVAGVGVVIRRVWEAHSNSLHQRVIRDAEQRRDYTLLADWETRSEQAKQRRHDRHMDWMRSPGKIPKMIAAVVGSVFGLLLLLGIVLAVSYEDISWALAPIRGLFDGIREFTEFIAAVWTPFVLVGPWVLLAWLWNLGRRKARMPALFARAADRASPDARQVVPDEGAILLALQHLGIAALNRQFKAGWRPRWVQGTGRDGKGYRTQLEMPLEVPVQAIVDKKPLLAHNLARLPVEVWPTEPKDQPGVLDLWVADRGALTGPVDPWPLLNDGTCDYFKGVPVGVDIRGNVIRGGLFEANYAIAGIMGSGKSTLIITLLLGAILDPLVEVDVFVFAENADYDPLRPRLRSLTTGAEPENIERCMALLRELFSELAVRGRALQEHGERKVTRRLAEQDKRLRPRVMVVDECQNLFLSEFGEEAAETAVKLKTTARKYAITLIWATPEPSSDSLPRKMMAITSNKACFAIGDQISNDAVLGTGSYKAGISAVSLEPKTPESHGDVGTAMVRGFTSRPGLMRTYYVRKEGAVDEVTPVVQRALALRDKAGITATPLLDAPADPDRDLLEDVATVLGPHPRMRTQEVLQHLAELDRAAYGRWTFADLKRELPEPAKPYKTLGNWQVGLDRILRAIAERDEIGSDEDGET